MINEKGSSFIEVLVTMAIMSTVTLTMGKMMYAQQQSIGMLQDQLTKNQIEKNLNSIVLSTEVCDNNFVGIRTIRGKEVEYDELKDQNNESFFVSGSQIDHVELGQIRLEVEEGIAPDSSGFVEVKIPIHRTRLGGGPSSLKPASTKIWVHVDSSRKIVSCDVGSPDNKNDESDTEDESPSQAGDCGETSEGTVQLVQDKKNDETHWRKEICINSNWSVIDSGVQYGP